MNSSIRILLADDDAEDRFILTDSFREVGFSGIIKQVDDGIQAISYLEDAAASGMLPALVILDLNMPRLNGTEALRKIKSNPHLHTIPVIIFSTSINEIEKEECLRLGATAYMTKPGTHAESLAIARHFCEFTAKLAMPECVA